MIRRGSAPALLILLASVEATAQSTQAGPSMANAMLAAHNAVRERAGVPPLAWSDRLAHAWADTLLSRNQFKHRKKSPYGENLFEIRGGRVSPEEVVEDWASEAPRYDYRRNRCHGMCGHYTQLVWRGTTQVGCAVARGKGREIWDCEYNPPGNIIGQRPY